MFQIVSMVRWVGANQEVAPSYMRLICNKPWEHYNIPFPFHMNILLAKLTSLFRLSWAGRWHMEITLTHDGGPMRESWLREWSPLNIHVIILDTVHQCLDISEYFMVDLTQWFTAVTQWFTAAKGGRSLHMATMNLSCSNSTSLFERLCDLGWWYYLTRGGAVHSREGSG